jgi:hypothetical protein
VIQTLTHNSSHTRSALWLDNESSVDVQQSGLYYKYFAAAKASIFRQSGSFILGGDHE